MRTRTVLLTVGRSGTPPPELGPRIPGSVEVGGRVIESSGASLVELRHRSVSRECAFLDRDCICRHCQAVVLVALLEGAPLWWWMVGVSR